MDAETLKLKFETEWGRARKFIAAHPLTAAWIALAAGFVIGFVAGR